MKFLSQLASMAIMYIQCCTYTWKGVEAFIGSFVDAAACQATHLVIQNILDLVLKDAIKEIIQPTAEENGYRKL